MHGIPYSDETCPITLYLNKIYVDIHLQDIINWSDTSLFNHKDLVK